MHIHLGLSIYHLIWYFFPFLYVHTMCLHITATRVQQKKRMIGAECGCEGFHEIRSHRLHPEGSMTEISRKNRERRLMRM